MSENTMSPKPVFDADPGETASALFAELIMRQTQMALLLLGRVPHPESGKSYRDLDGARLAIDQLEMLELKTKGNLTKDEAALLKQSLMTLRMAFVETAEAAASEAKSGEGEQPAKGNSPDSGPAADKKIPGTPPPGEESRTKFSKKY